MNLQNWIIDLEKEEELLRISTPVSPNQEIAEIADRMMKQPNGGKALLFENTGTQFPLLINAYGSEKRMQSVFGDINSENVFSELFQILDELQSSQRLLSKIKVLIKNRKLAGIFPKTTNSKAACQECLMETPDLTKLPILQSWPFDPAPFFTLPMVFTKNPTTGNRNIGMYRMQVMGKTKTGMHWHRHKGGAAHFKEWKKQGGKMPVAVVLGGDPLYTYLATAPLPENIDELLFCGLIRKKAVKLTKCVTQDIEVPVDADIVIEGYIDTNAELVKEGPFGDHTGFYSLEDFYPQFHVTAITHKKDAVYPATIVGIPPMEDLYLGLTTERLFKEAIKKVVAPELIDFHLPAEGVAHNLVLLKVKNEWPGAVSKTMFALLGAGQMMFSKFLVAMPENADLTDYKTIVNLIASNISADSFLIANGPADELEHASPELVFGGKCLLDLSCATYNNEIHYNHEIDKIEYGNIRIVTKEFDFKNVDSEFLISIFVDYQELLLNVNALLWWILANTDPRRDITRVGNKILWDARHIADHKQKQRKWPNPVVSSVKTIEFVDGKWNDYNIGPFITSPSLNAKCFVKAEGASLKNT